MLNQEVRAALLCLDVVQNAVDGNALFDYMKQNFKKEITLLNGIDFGDAAGRSSKAEQKKDKTVKYDMATGICRGIKQKIDSDLAKVAEVKKKALAAWEKQRAFAKSKGKPVEELSRSNYLFEGTIDSLYVLNNFPYFPAQLAPLVEIETPVAFICIVPRGGATPASYTKRVTEKSGRQPPPPKKAPIAGNDIDSTLNPHVYPPTRWLAMRPTAPVSVPFLVMEAGDDVESTFKKLEREIALICFARDEYVARFASRTFVSLPVRDVHPDLTHFSEFLTEHPDDDVNAMLYALREANWKTKAPDPPQSMADKYDEILNKGKSVNERSVVLVKREELPDPDFETSVVSSVAPLLYRVLNWELQVNHAATCIAMCEFLMDPTNYYAYAGQKFDQMFVSANKKHQLGLPAAFFDWMKWDLHTEWANVDEPLGDAIAHAGIVETLLDEQVGILWIMTLPPIARTMGHFTTHYSMPQTMDGFTDFIHNLYQKEGEGDKRVRNPPSPAQLIREKGDFSAVMPSLSERVDRVDRIYGLPLECSNCAEFSASYYFPSQLRVNMNRKIVNGKPTFGYEASFKTFCDIIGRTDSICIVSSEGIRIVIDFPFAVTLLYNENSVRYDATVTHLKATAEEVIIISDDGTLILTGPEGKTMFLPDGTIGRYSGGLWTYVTKECDSFKKMADGFVWFKQRFGQTHDLENQETRFVRPDGIEYTIGDDGTRQIVCGREVTLTHRKDKITIDAQAPKFPVLVKEGDVMSLSLDCFEISFSGKTAKITCEDYRIEVTEECVMIISEEVEMRFAVDRCEFKSGDQVFVATGDGIEKMVQIGVDIPVKKKVEIYETHWGRGLPIKETLAEPQQLELHQIFVPQFFAVRANDPRETATGELGGSMFLRADTLITEGLTVQDSFVRHPAGQRLDCRVTHHPENGSQMFIVNEPLNKAARSSLVKGVHIAKTKKKKGPGDPDDQSLFKKAMETHGSFVSYSNMFSMIMDDRLSALRKDYIESITPPEPEPPEQIIVPPPTPQPRLLNMQTNIHQGRVANGPLKYWSCGESMFAMPGNGKHTMSRLLSPRVALCDPPRTEKYTDNGPPVLKVPVMQQHRTCNSSMQVSVNKVVPERPVIVKAVPEVISFGTVKANTRVIASSVLTNIGPKPLHFTFSQPSNKLFKVLTVPGVVFPGLKVTVKVALEPAEAQRISACFTVTLKEPMEGPREVKIPLVVTISE